MEHPPIMKVGDAMTASPKSISADTPFAEARKVMHELRVRHLPITRSGKVIGILSERLLSAAMVTREHSQLNLEDIMIPDPFVVTPETPVSQVVAVMMEEKYGCAIVQKNEELVGIFTTIDALRILKGLL